MIHRHGYVPSRLHTMLNVSDYRKRKHYLGHICTILLNAVTDYAVIVRRAGVTNRATVGNGRIMTTVAGVTLYHGYFFELSLMNF